jgi:hypothetical protein
MYFDISGRTYRTSFDQISTGTHAFFVSTSAGTDVGQILAWDPDSPVVPELEPLEDSTRVLKEIAKRLCDRPTCEEAMRRSA